MATRKKTGTLTSVGRTVKKAAKAVAQTADEYVVEPVGKALGLTGKKKPAKKKAATSTAKKPAGRQRPRPRPGPPPRRPRPSAAQPRRAGS